MYMWGSRPPLPQEMSRQKPRRRRHDENETKNGTTAREAETNPRTPLLLKRLGHPARQKPKTLQLPDHRIPPPARTRPGRNLPHLPVAPHVHAGLRPPPTTPTPLTPHSHAWAPPPHTPRRPPAPPPPPPPSPSTPPNPNPPPPTPQTPTTPPPTPSRQAP